MREPDPQRIERDLYVGGRYQIRNGGVGVVTRIKQETDSAWRNHGVTYLAYYIQENGPTPNPYEAAVFGSGPFRGRGNLALNAPFSGDLVEELYSYSQVQLDLFEES